MKSGNVFAKKARKSKTSTHSGAVRALQVPGITKPVPVIVKNLKTAPVPVQPQGETTIVGSVAITNTPTVTVAATAGAYANMIRLLGRAWADEGFDAADGSTVDQGGNPFVVPAGKRLMVESLSGTMRIPSGQTALYVSFWTGHPKLSQYLAPQLSTSGVDFGNYNVDFYTIEERRVCAFADAGEQLHIAFTRKGSTGAASVSITFNGYLIDIS